MRCDKKGQEMSDGLEVAVMVLAGDAKPKCTIQDYYRKSVRAGFACVDDCERHFGPLCEVTKRATK